MARVRIGLERFLSRPPRWAEGARLGLLCNQASVDAKLRHAAPLLRERVGKQLTCLFSPQHGLWGEKQDNMIESADSRDPVTGLLVFSLYGERRRPTPEQLSRIDWLLIDLQDVGTRVYTFSTTVAYCLEEAARAGVGVAVLDRPNPIGGVQFEGNPLKDSCRSFVGVAAIPQRHGLTLGELARFYRASLAIDVRLEVVPMSGWRREMHWPETGLPWAMPSPNMPTYECALVYPGQVALEGTNLSEGRGTTRPFEICGAPFVEPHHLAARLTDYRLPGVVFRPLFFEPTFHKWAGKPCGGVQLHVTSPATFRPYRTNLALLREAISLWPREFAWREPPYEYERTRTPIDLILGDEAIRGRLEAGEELPAIEASWRKDLAAYARRRRGCLLY